MDQIKRFLGFKIVLFLLLLAVIWVGLVSVKAYWRKQQLDQEIASLKKEIEKLDNSSQEFSRLIEYFNDQDFLAREAKEKLNLKAEGESVVMVPEVIIGQELESNVAQNDTVDIQQGVEKKSENNLVKWWKYIFGR